MDVSLLIRLVDQASAPANKIASALGKIQQQAGEFRRGMGTAIREGFDIENVEAAAQRAEAAAGRARARLVGAFGMAMTLGAPLFQSGKFDQSMRGLDKVLDVSTSRLAELRRFALDTSAIVPIAARELVELMAEAAQGGVPEESLEAFARYVANAAVAFDMAGGEIGERFAKLRNVYQLNQEQIEDLGDATNHLSNNMAAKASELTDFTNRAAGAAKTLNLSATQMTAVGAAMIASGIVPETAARGLNALATRILAGSKKIDAAFRSIGMSRDAYLEELQRDGPAALQRLFDVMAESPEGMKALIEIVGRDFTDDFAKLLGNPELLAEALELVSDKAAYAGSAVEEAAKQAEGAEKKWDLFINKLSRLSIVIGDQLLPHAIALTDRVGDLVDRLADFAEANPQLTGAIVKTIAALLALSIGSRLLAFAFASLRLSAIGLARAFLLFKDGRNVAVGWRLLSGVGRMLGGTLGSIRVVAMAAAGALAGLSAPVLAAVAAIAAAGLVVWKYWDRVSSFASGFASVFGDLIGSAVRGAIGWIDGLIGKIAELLGIDGRQFEAFKKAVREGISSAFDFSGLIDGARQMLAGFWTWLGSIFSAENLTDAEKAEMFEAGRALAQSLTDGLMQSLANGWAAIEEWVSGKIALLRETFTFEWPSWLGGDGPETRAAGDRSAAIAESARKANAGAAGGGAIDRMQSGMDRLAAGAAEDMTRGGTAVEQGGTKAAEALREGAEASAAMIRDAARTLAAAVGNASAGRASVGGAIAGARTGALHGGTD